jgi:very-short-patch-repair endonuclease
VSPRCRFSVAAVHSPERTCAGQRHDRSVLTEIDTVLRRHGGVAPRAALVDAVGRSRLDHEVRSGRLVAPFPRALCRPWDADLELDRAALISVGPPATLSHLTALRRWGVHDPDPDEDIHVTVPATRCPTSRPGLRVHRVARWPPTAGTLGLPTVHPADAGISSWSLLPARQRREPIITATRRKLISTDQLRAALAANQRAPGRDEMVRLVGLLEAGCESELEIWGLLGVFDFPGLRHAVRQRSVLAGGRWWRLDLAYEQEKVAVELDGYRYHSTREQREKDMRRDAAVATMGWVTLRYSHDRLHDDVAGCRRDTLATLAARRR